jgi:quercetin dioxygenase-like cupin family protein
MMGSKCHLKGETDMAEMKITPPKIRRIVTAEDTEEKSYVWMDSQPTNVKTPNPAYWSTLLWATEGAPADFKTMEDAGSWKLGTAPPPGGCRFMYSVFAPGTESKSMEMHRTDSLDFSVVLKGQLTLILDKGEVTFGPGSVLVQRGTNHVWANRGTEQVEIVAVMLDGRPKREGSLSGARNAR